MILCSSNSYYVSSKSRVHSVQYTQYHNYSPFTHYYTPPLLILVTVTLLQYILYTLCTQFHFPSTHYNYCYIHHYTYCSVTLPHYTLYTQLLPPTIQFTFITCQHCNVHTATLPQYKLFTQFASPLKLYKQFHSKTTYCTHPSSIILLVS